ncbi:isopentenyl-diphosphate Delta-isomerase [Patescibacteria group bacterium]|nr:isopentenyl-diphosphate Delta-isomerase [Patescibacteria group bacterium]MBU2259076.1 isopentenyl-diphosphate Delta-isomerase [Patescibacteria group bacterium]
MRHVILCDEQGNPKGTTSIADAHKAPGRLHKAFSVFLIDQQRKEILMQLRAQDKLFGGLWSNTCCSHPQEDQKILLAGMQRTKYECGFDCPPLQELCSFVYEAEDPNGKGWEREYDTVLVGDAFRSVQLNPNQKEIKELKWMSLKQIQRDLSPEIYTPWFLIAFKRILDN